MLPKIMQFFKYDHLRPELQVVSVPFGVVAKIVAGLPDNPERAKALDLLLAAKDAAVRASFYKDEG